MTTITIPRALLEQALANMVRAELLYGQPNQAIQEAIRAALSAPATAPEQPAWQDAPTCAGVWVNSISGRVNVVIEETLSAWQHSGARYYGPIPPDSGDRP